MKIHLLWKKEEINESQISDDKIVVVFDVLMATSTITSCLAYGAKQVIPVLDKTEALETSKMIKQEGDDNVLLVGESDGLTIDGFMDPFPSVLNGEVAGKTVILSTTNGTVAIRKAAFAKKVYTASLLNGQAVGKRIADTYEDETIVVICSGSKNTFCLEDYFGAGYFINCLMNEYGQDSVDLTDSALSAKLFYEHLPDQATSILNQSRVGRMLSKYGFNDDIEYISKQGVLDIVPCLNIGVNTLTNEVIDNKTAVEWSVEE